MTLPADVARCPGVEAEGVWREGCEDCLRRTAEPIEHPMVTWMEPPMVVFECAYRLEPSDE